MENIYKKIENELNNLSGEEREKILLKLRQEIDKIDEEIVPLLGRRSLNAILIGRVKRSLNIPTYDPEREKDIAKRIVSFKKEPLSDEALLRIYERIIDESRSIQNEEIRTNKLIKIPEDAINDSQKSDKLNMKNVLPKKYLFLILFVFIFLLALFYYTFFTPNYYEGNSPRKFEIKQNETFSSVTERLVNEGIIPGETNFKIAGFLYGAETKVRAARYYIPNGLSYLDLLDLFIKGDADFLRKVKIYDGASVKLVASSLKMNASIDSSAFVELVSNKNTADSLGIKAEDLQGYLLPQEYYFYERSSASEALDTIYSAFNAFINSAEKNDEINSKYSLHQVLTMASIVEGETNKVKEMPAIAGVYYNRLRIGMRLQADPTIQFFQKDGWKRLLYEDLKNDHPYNTYIYYGLPPGPINNPGKTAIAAALNPEKHDYLFFVADGKGGHKFAKNYTQHLKNVKEYREWLKAQAKN